VIAPKTNNSPLVLNRTPSVLQIIVSKFDLLKSSVPHLISLSDGVLDDDFSAPNPQLFSEGDHGSCFLESEQASRPDFEQGWWDPMLPCLDGEKFISVAESTLCTSVFAGCRYLRFDGCLTESNEIPHLPVEARLTESDLQPRPCLDS